MMFGQRKQAGFTLVEVLTVVAILAILGAVAVVGYQKYAARARSADIIEKYDAVRTGVAAKALASKTDDCAALVGTLGNSNLSSDYAGLTYGFEAVKDGYRPVLNVCAQFDPAKPLPVKVAREAHDVLAKNGVVEKNAVVTDSVVSFALRLSDGDVALCKTAPVQAATTCGQSQPAAQASAQTPAPAKPATQADCLPHQSFTAGVGCSNVCTPGFYFVQGPPVRCSATPVAASATVSTAAQTPAQVAPSVPTGNSVNQDYGCTADNPKAAAWGLDACKNWYRDRASQCAAGQVLVIDWPRATPPSAISFRCSQPCADGDIRDSLRPDLCVAKPTAQSAAAPAAVQASSPAAPALPPPGSSTSPDAPKVGRTDYVKGFGTQGVVQRDDAYWLLGLKMTSPDGNPIRIVAMTVNPPSFASVIGGPGNWGFKFSTPRQPGQGIVTVTMQNGAGMTTAQFTLTKNP